MTRKPLKIFAVAALLLAASLVFYQTAGWARFSGHVNRLNLDLGEPDGLIVTRSLSRLPRDLLRVPLLKDVLTEDFAFYYENNEDRLSLSGSLRRLAFEHELQWGDRLIDWALDEPADLAVWRDAKGVAEYHALAMSRNTLAKAIQEAATLSLKDSQLTMAGEIQVDGDAVPVLALRHGRDRTALFASRGDRVVVLSDPGMLLADNGKPDAAAAAVVAKLLSGNQADQQVFRRHFDLPAQTAEHSLALSARYLSFGYRHFFPAFETLRFDFDGKRWSTALRLADGAALASDATARALPARPAACAWLPMAWSQAGAVLPEKADPPLRLPVLASTAAACWYGQSALQSPLFVAELAAEPDATTDATLAALFAWAVKGEAQTPAPRKNTALWQKRTPAPYGNEAEGDDSFYRPTLARRGRLLVFSADARLVAKALDTLDRRYPSVKDSLPAGGVDLALLTPQTLAQIVRSATVSALPRDQQPVLRDAAETHLMPRLAALAKYPAYRLRLAEPARAGGWHAVEWQELAR